MLATLTIFTTAHYLLGEFDLVFRVLSGGLTKKILKISFFSVDKNNLIRYNLYMEAQAKAQETESFLQNKDGKIFKICKIKKVIHLTKKQWAVEYEYGLVEVTEAYNRQGGRNG